MLLKYSHYYWCIQSLAFNFLILNANAKRKHIQEGKIVGGVETSIDQVPYLVNLRVNGQFICGGTLITPTCVLTAAHCVFGMQPSTLTVNAGSSRLSEAGFIQQVQQHFVSPFYSRDNLNMDVAVLKLVQPLVGNNVATIRYCNTPPAADQLVQISGWGITSETNRQPSDQVRTAYVRVISDMDCRKAYAAKAHLTNTMFCAAIPGEIDSCSGDSGGPVVYNGQVCGIVSWGFGCARQEYPGVYTKVASRRINTFIRQILKQHCS